MVEPRRADTPHEGDDATRDVRIEALLVEGLDRYFAGRFDDAVHLWTRVLFLDRTHARARAYIDRARTAIAERQRRADEWLRASEAMLAEGRAADARHLLEKAVAAAGDDEPASAVRARLERLERARAASTVADPVPAIGGAPLRAWTWPRRSPAAAMAIVAIVVAIGVALVALAGDAGSGRWLGTREAHDRLAATATPARLRVLTSADVALVRARTLLTRGRLAEALEALDRVPPESPARAEAERLRVEIQQLLLASSRVRASSSGSGESR
jgi:hypothetical protein